MKVSLKLEDQQQQQNQNQNQNQNPIHFKAKIPITVFGLPFLSAFSATHHHSTTADKLSFSLRTHFLSGPSLKLSYNTPTTTVTTATAPLTLTLKSGVSLSGSPNNSPLIISANFSISPQNPNPSFTLQLKPRLGSFSLHKSISSNISSSSKKINNGSVDGSENSYGFVPLDRTINWKELTVESATKDSILSAILMTADTEMPVTKRVKVNLRWGVNIPSNFEKQLPYLIVNKIKIERIDVKEEDSRIKKQGIGSESGSGEFEMLKGMYAWMSRELSDLQNENREMRRALEDIKSRPILRKQDGYNGGRGKRVVPLVVENSDGFEQWRMKKNGGGGGEANGLKKIKKNGASVDVESELQRAIKAASSSQ